uniref:HVA22-like protein n=2 Tax=Triticum urartu TaxID=4572 RepID=A0A8R7QDQ6_TRIUA
MEVRPARIKPRPEPAMGNPPRLQRVGRHCRKRKREEGGGRGRAAPVAACTWPWRRSGGGGVGRCSSRRPRQATTWCHLPPTPAASCCGCWQWRSESPTLPPPLLAVRPSFRPWRRRPPASAGSARWQATTTATSASKTPGLCWNIFGHCLINFTELLNTIDLCGNRWSIRVLVAMSMVVERFVDWMVSWLLMYGEAKLLLVIYLWHPSTRGAGHVYDGFLHLLVALHEADIDRGLLELMARARDVTTSQLKAAAAIGQVWLVEAARCVSSQLQAARSGREGATH